MVAMDRRRSVQFLCQYYKVQRLVLACGYDRSMRISGRRRGLSWLGGTKWLQRTQVASAVVVVTRGCRPKTEYPACVLRARWSAEVADDFGARF